MLSLTTNTLICRLYLLFSTARFKMELMGSECAHLSALPTLKYNLSEEKRSPRDFLSFKA